MEQSVKQLPESGTKSGTTTIHRFVSFCLCRTFASSINDKRSLTCWNNGHTRKAAGEEVLWSQSDQILDIHANINLLIQVSHVK